MSIPSHDNSFRRLSKVAKVILGQSPDSRTYNDQGEGMPFLQGNAEFGERRPTHRLFCTAPSRLCEEGDILLSVRAPVGATNQADRIYAIGRGLAAIRFAENDRSYGWHALRHGVPQLDLLAQGSTFAAISRKEIEELLIWFPDGDAKLAIAGILDTVQLAIEQTEALLAKQQRIKMGLMHDLLTRGVDAQGRLRDPSTHQFKPSIFGPIPAQWDVKPLMRCTKVPITYGIVQAGPHISGGVPYIRTGDMGGDELIRETMLCTSPEIASHFRRSEVRAGEIVCAIRATVGKVLLVPENLDGANLTQGTARISPNNETSGPFLLWSLRAYRTQQEIALQSKGTTFAEITLTDLRKIPVVMPQDPDEQTQIAKTIDKGDKALARSRTRLEKLKRTMTGLMNDLLTGRVPVTQLMPTFTR
jgi:type I restriction enzyme S subunit